MGKSKKSKKKAEAKKDEKAREYSLELAKNRQTIDEPYPGGYNRACSTLNGNIGRDQFYPGSFAWEMAERVQGRYLRNDRTPRNASPSDFGL